MRFAFLISLLAAGCAALPAAQPRPLAGDEALLVRRAALAVELERPDAGERVDALLRRYPDSVDGRRLRQVLRARDGEDWRLFEEARSALAAASRDPAASYLLARVIPDRAEQARRFRECLEEDPSFFHGAFGLGVAELSLGRPGAAVEHAERALAIRPGDPDGLGLLASARAAANPREGEDAWAAVLEDAPDWPAVALGAARFFGGRGDGQRAAAALLAALRASPGAVPLAASLVRVVRGGGVREETLREASALAGTSAAGRVLSATVERGLGVPGGALSELDAALSAGASEVLLGPEFFAAAVLAGDFARAERTWRASLPTMVLTDGNLRREAVEELGLALLEAAAEPDRGAVLGRLGRALSGAGYADLAAPVAASALARDPGNRELALLAGETAAWLRFLSAVRERVERGYRRESREEGREDLSELLEAVRGDSRRLLGRDMLADLTDLSVPLAGRLLRSDRSEEWLSRGMLLVLGQRAGGPPEAKLLRIMAVFRGRRSGDAVHDLVVGEDAGLGAFAEREGRRIGGFTLPGFVTVDTEGAMLWAVEVGRRRGGATGGGFWPASPAYRASLWYPGPALRDLARGCRQGDLDAALAHVLTHEEGHLVDIERFHPVLRKLPAVLLELAWRGFSARAIEEGLEERAETHALARGPDARLGLLQTLAEATGPGGTAHRAAYRRIVTELIGEILEHPERYPSVDPRYNVVQQLGRLTDAELEVLLGR
ncbi:MAG: hypothetical protein MUE73_03335 [Planctomycetes bacterium]|jgi:tetratricopeptide (TPR) repeat protein|nr:hypothetical protein [Planctomycetota bacterium]